MCVVLTLIERDGVTVYLLNVCVVILEIKGDDRACNDTVLDWRQQGSMAAGQHGSRAAWQQGSRAAGQHGSRGLLLSSRACDDTVLDWRSRAFKGNTNKKDTERRAIP